MFIVLYSLTDGKETEGEEDEGEELGEEEESGAISPKRK